MAVIEDRRASTETPPEPRPPWWRRLVAGVVLAGTSVGLFFAYLAMSRTQPTNADGASQALQAWDMLHGNLLLTGWTVSDVSFYTNELLILAAAEAVQGLNADVVHVCAAVLYTLLVLGVAALARGRATGREAAFRIVLALAVMLVPMGGMGTSVLLLSPDHTGTAVPLLLTLIVVERGLTRRDGAPRWLPFAVGGLLAAGQIADPLMLYIGVLPFVAVCGLRLWRSGRRRPRQWRGTEARLAAAAFASTIVAELVLRGIHLAGGFHVHAVPAGVAKPTVWPDHVWIMAESLSADFGAYFHDRGPGLDTAMGVARLFGLLVTMAVVAVVLVRWLRGRSSDSPASLVDHLLAVGVGVNLGAFVVSTIPYDVTSARQIAAVLFLGAALVGRVVGPLLAPVRWMPALLAVVITVYGGEFVVRTMEDPVPHENHEMAEYLLSRNLTYGLGGFWTANNISLQTGDRVHVAPVIGEERVYGYRWLSKEEWYDPARHDARFMVVKKGSEFYGSEAGAVASFGEPVERHRIGDLTVLVYDHNLLVGLPALCMPGTAPSMADCP